MTPPAEHAADDESGSVDEARTDARVPLAEHLRARIERTGPLTFRDWMQAALYDEREGYYRRRGRTRWGRAGDYRTSPERSLLFAATFARHFVALDEELGSPRELHLVESGGGAGHFARGLLATLARDAPALFARLRYVFDEASADARERAAALLAPFGERVEFRCLDEIGAPLDAALIFSNELLDALPVHRVLMRGGRLLELCVGLDAADRFTWVERKPSTPRLAEHFGRLRVTLDEGQAAEVNLEAEAWLERAARSLRRGYVVTVDYGAEADALYGAPHRHEGTLRAFSGHTLSTEALAHPGEQDLTTTVNWTQIITAGERAGLERVLLERQDAFLLRAGLLAQLERESAHARDEAERVALRLDAREMILPGGMSGHFQVLVQRKRV